LWYACLLKQVEIESKVLTSCKHCLNKVRLTEPYPHYCVQRSICISWQILTTYIAYRREQIERER
jgi:hypothetical protein